MKENRQPFTEVQKLSINQSLICQTMYVSNVVIIGDLNIIKNALI